jgi:hypothetical protein
MNRNQSRGTSWTARLIGTCNESERTNQILARYAHFVYANTNLLGTFSLEEIIKIGEKLLLFPDKAHSLLEPYSFGDLFLDDHSPLQKKFNCCGFPLQCRVLDVAWVYAKAKNLFALIAIDWISGRTQLLALSPDTARLKIEAQGFLSDPLTETMIDTNTEKELANLLKTSKEILQTGDNKENTGVYQVICSKDFFVSNVYCFPLGCAFSLKMGKNQDEFGHRLPESIACTEKFQASVKSQVER